MLGEAKKQLFNIENLTGFKSKLEEVEKLKDAPCDILYNSIIKLRDILIHVNDNDIRDNNIENFIKKQKLFINVSLLRNKDYLKKYLELEQKRNDLEQLRIDSINIVNNVIENKNHVSQSDLYDTFELIILLLDYYPNEYNKIINLEVEYGIASIPFAIALNCLKGKFKYVDEDDVIRRNINMNAMRLKNNLNK